MFKNLLVSCLLLMFVRIQCDFSYSPNFYAEYDRNVVLVTNPKIFGLDLLGWGVDLKLGRPDEALRVPLFNWSYLDGNSYIYPLEPNTTFIVPDDVYVRTMAEIEASTQVFVTDDAYSKHLVLEFGLSGQAAGNSSDNASLAITSFSGSADIRYISDNLKDNKHMVIINSLDSNLWQIVMGPRDIYDTRAKVFKVFSNITAANPDDYLVFIEKFGTHFVESVIVGGTLEMNSIIDTTITNNTNTIGVTAAFSFKKAFGLSQGDLQFNATFVNQVNSFEQNSTSILKALGGDPTLANFFSGNNNQSETFVNWQNTLISNPAVVRYRLREISWLFPDRPLVSSYVRQYLTTNN